MRKILIKKEYIGTPKAQDVWGDRSIISLVKTSTFTTVGKIKNTLQDAGTSAIMSTIK